MCLSNIWYLAFDYCLQFSVEMCKWLGVKMCEVVCKVSKYLFYARSCAMSPDMVCTVQGVQGSVQGDQGCV